MEIEKIIRMLAVFIVVAAFALSVAARLLFPEASHLSDTPLLVLLILSVCAIWRDGRSRLLRTQDGP